MIASDLPEQHRNARAMARALSTYMDDPRAVQEAVKESYGRCIALCEIRDMRKRYERDQRKTPEPVYAGDAYLPHVISASAEVASKLFLRALEMERARSLARAKIEGALDSPALRKPEIVNQAWDRETEHAWLRNTELGR